MSGNVWKENRWYVKMIKNDIISTTLTRSLKENEKTLLPHFKGK